MSLKRSLKPFALANTLAALAISLPASAQVFPDSALGVVVPPPAVAKDVSSADAARQLPAMNSLYVADRTQPIVVQLAKFDGTSASELAGIALTVISPDTKPTRYKVNEDGAVVFQAEKSGVYAFLVSGPMGHVAFPVVVRLGSGQPTNDGAAATPTINLPIFNLSPGEAARAISSFLPPGNGALSDIDASLVSVGDVTSTINFRVNLSESGRMEGQVVTLMQSRLLRQNLEGNNLLLYKDGQLVARAISDSLGRFAFEDVQPGNYGIICAGPGGYAAFGFEAFTPSLSTALKNRETFVTKMVKQPPAAGPFSSGDVLPIVPIPRPLVPGLPALLRGPDQSEEESLIDPEAAFAPVPGGGGAGFGGGPGGGFGGGGAGGGMGGAGGLLGLAGLGIAAAAVASDSNDRVITNPTPDPATPANVLP